MWVTKLSGRQRLECAAAVLAATVIVLVGATRKSQSPLPVSPDLTVEMSIKEMASRLEVTGLEVTGKSLARELGLPLHGGKGRPVRVFGITQAELDHVTEHILSHRGPALKYYILAAMVLLGLVYLVRLGRPDGSPVSQRRTWYPRWPYLVVLAISVAVCGFALGKSPNPMESAVKVFKSMVGLYPSIVEKALALAFFGGLAVVGSKLICGWACPFGALQELIYHLPVLKKIKRRKVPFVVTNTIRSLIFATMLLMLFGVFGPGQGFVLYHYINPFNLFNLDFETVSVVVTILVVVAVSFGFYRPFCQFICPFGLLSWLLDRLSIFRVKVDHDLCTECGACINACPLDAARDRVAGKIFPAECFSCARCLNVCPVDAISYGLVGMKRAVPTKPGNGSGG